MKDYEIVRQGSRYVVKTRKDNDDYIVSAPFRTHAAAQGYVDQQRAATDKLGNVGPEESKKAIADAENYEATGSKYGFTAYEGKQYALLGAPSFAGVYGLGISADNYSALCIDVNGKEYTAFFEVLERDTDNSAFADWDNASLVERVQ